MALEIHDYNRDDKSLHDECKRHMYYHVILTMADGSIVDGIIENVDGDRVTMLVGEDVMEQDDDMLNNDNITLMDVLEEDTDVLDVETSHL